jgi:hypothetical protein
MAAPYHALRHTGSAAFGRAEGMLPAGDFRDLATNGEDGGKYGWLARRSS